MSTEVYLQAFEAEQDAPLSEDDVVAAFHPFIDRHDPEAWRVRYDDMNSSTVYPHRSPTGALTGFAVSRPCGDPRLWTAIHRVLAMGNCVAYMPDGVRPVVARAHAVSHLPLGIIKTLGEPVLAESADALQDGLFGDG